LFSNSCSFLLSSSTAVTDILLQLLLQQQSASQSIEAIQKEPTSCNNGFSLLNTVAQKHHLASAVSQSLAKQGASLLSSSANRQLLQHQQ
jgi:hypothetical protein